MRKKKELIIKEVGWVPPSDENKGLHTSCKIEKCKEYSQFINFYQMKSKIIPFSAIELALASRNQNLTREEAILDINHSLGFSLQEPAECKIMIDYLKSEHQLMLTFYIVIIAVSFFKNSFKYNFKNILFENVRAL